jgi:glycerol-3-phosphate cytidylyltransferase-like family protein
MVMVGAVKWVDDVIPDAPYAITEDFMKKLFTEYNIDYIIHGDDPCLLPDGTDAYALAKNAGRYKQIKRTEGVSTTDIVGISSAFCFLFLLFTVEVQGNFCVLVLSTAIFENQILVAFSVETDSDQPETYFQ